jgi:hypothetical protein
MYRLFANISSGLRTGEPKWVIPGMILVAAALFVFFNAPVGEGVAVRGSVTGCVSGVQRLTGAQSVSCTVKLDDGTIQQTEAPGHSSPGAQITFHRYERRIIGTYYSSR